MTTDRTNGRTPMRLALCGFGDIARDLHVPAILDTPGIDLIAIASPHNGLDGVPWYPTLEALLVAEPTVDAIAMCTPAPVRHELALFALESGRHVMLDRPPGNSLTGIDGLLDEALRARLTLLAAWPARFGAAIEPAREHLARFAPTAIRVVWNEDASGWNSDHGWIWQPGGLGAFHTGIGALSILRHLLPDPLVVTGSTLSIPANRSVPIAADMTLTDRSGCRVDLSIDVRPGTARRHEITIQTAAGTLVLGERATTLTVNGRVTPLAAVDLYRGAYRYLLECIKAGACDLDTKPLVQVADAHLLAERITTEPFGDRTIDATAGAEA